LPACEALHYTRPASGLGRTRIKDTRPSMLTALRAFAKSKAAVVLLGLLIVSFAVFGIGDVFQNQTGDWVVRAGSRKVAAAEFSRIFDNVKAEAQQQAQRPINNQEAVERGLHLRVLNDLAQAEALAEIMRRAGLVPADELVAAEIRKAPVFFDAVSGRFDEAAYQRQLAENKLTPERFEGFLRDEIAQSHFVAAVVGNLRAPRVYAAAAQAFEGEVRDLSMLIVHPGLVQAPPAPTDAQLTAFMQENAERLRRPEMRALTVVRFDAANVASQIVVDPAEVQRRYEFRRESLSTPERRTLVQIPARTAQAAADAARRLRAGEDPAAVARALGVEPVRYNDAPRSAITDRRVAEAAFALQPGQVSNPIQGELSLAVVKLLGVTPGRLVGIEEIRPQIEAELRAEAAGERVYELVQKYEEARESGASMVDAARTVGVPALSLAPVTQDGRDQRGQPVPLEPQVLRAAFDLSQGGESDVEELARGRYAAVRVERVLPAALPPLAEIRPQLTQVWQARELSRRVQARADALAAEARRGRPLQTVASAAGAPFTTERGIVRTAQGGRVPQDVLGAAFAAGKGEIFLAPTQAGVIVGRIDAVRSTPAPQLAAGLEQRRQAMSLDLIQDVGRLVRVWAQRVLKVRTNPERAAQALGVDPEQLKQQQGAPEPAG
jgi:peptidyl-prolyl cis-trans isomerase D